MIDSQAAKRRRKRGGGSAKNTVIDYEVKFDKRKVGDVSKLADTMQKVVKEAATNNTLGVAVDPATVAKRNYFSV